MSNKLVKNTSKKVNEGVEFYNQIGLIFICCGVISFVLLSFVSFLPQDYEKYNVSLFFDIWAVISLILVIIGVVPILLGKTCKKYQSWIEKEVNSYQDKMLKKKKS